MGNTHTTTRRVRRWTTLGLALSLVASSALADEPNEKGRKSAKPGSTPAAQLTRAKHKAGKAEGKAKAEAKKAEAAADKAAREAKHAVEAAARAARLEARAAVAEGKQAMKQAHKASREATKATRDAVLEAAKAARDATREATREAQAEVEAIAKAARDKAKEAGEDAKAQAEAGKRAMAEAMQAATEKARAARAVLREQLRAARWKVLQLQLAGEDVEVADGTEGEAEEAADEALADGEKAKGEGKSQAVPPAVTQELRRHAMFVARLNRIRELSEAKKNRKAIKRTDAAMEKELERHSRKMAKLTGPAEPGATDEADEEGEADGKGKPDDTKAEKKADHAEEKK